MHNCFHKMANSNRRKNSIDSLLIEGTLSTNRVEISEYIVQFYKRLYTKQFNRRPLVDGLSFDSALEFEAAWLEKDFGEGEVQKVVTTMVRDKALGPNNFSMAFFQAC